MNDEASQKLVRAVLYGGASVLLLFDIFFLGRSLLQGSFIPLLPLTAGIFITAGLLLIIYVESQSQAEDKREHRRLSRVAHQLENPLQALQEDLQYLVRESKNLPSEHRLKLKRMETKTNILLENIRDVFLMLQTQSGILEQDAAAYDMCTIVDDVVNRLKPQAAARNVEIIRKSHCANAPVNIDRRLFMVAFTHILENAMLYTVTPGLVNVAIIRGKKIVRILVQDRGVGILPKDAQSVFLPFARGHAADQFDPDGIGVGLTLARLIIQQIGGSLTWRPRQNSTGTEFEIKLSLAAKV